jgi:hypothetical protein
MAGVSYLVQNNMLLNYDSWAYRHTWWEDLQENMHWFPMWFPFAGSLPFKVNSAFGGSVLYETKMFLSADYDGYDCEHVCFHKNILTKNPECKLFMNPSQLMVV